MNIRLLKASASDIHNQLLVLPVHKGEESAGIIRELSRSDIRLVKSRIERQGFKASAHSTLTVQHPDADIVLVGIGEGTTDDWRKIGAVAHATARRLRCQRVAVHIEAGENDLDDLLEAAIEGFGLGGYTFDKYKSRRKGKGNDGDTDDAADTKVTTVTFFSKALVAGAKSRARVKKAVTLVEAVALARDLVNEIPGITTPNYLAATARRLARKGGLTCHVWKGARLRKERMNGIEAVSAGSKEPGALIKLVYKPSSRPRAKVCVVGKGITFDSGGLSLKPGKAMETMKLDMAGAAAVLGLMQTVSILKPKVEVHGFIATAENMPSGTAQRPGDIITFRNGKTAEVLNTDAEGRLVLADALCLANELKPDAIIDLATLTGACMVSLGLKIAGVMGNDDELIADVIQAGARAGEKLWQLPLEAEYAKDIRSGIADMKNIGGGYAGAITAALFLKNFVGESKWAHLDIAGPAFTHGSGLWGPSGGTGFGVRTLTAWIEALGGRS